MASTRSKRKLTSVDRWNLERILFEELSKINVVPANQENFTKYVKKQYGAKRFPAQVIRSVWLKLQHCENGITGKVETIELSSSSSGDDNGNCPLTHLIDFDMPEVDNEPQIRIIKESVEPPATTESKSKPKSTQKSQKTPQKRSPVGQTHKKTSPKRRVSEDRALLKKFRQKIILDELLRRDRQMLEVRGRMNNVEEAVAIEVDYAKRIQKDRVDALAMEMLRKHYQEEGLGEPYVQQPGGASIICLIDPVDYIPSETVITERLPSIEVLNEAPCLDFRDLDFPQFDLYGSSSEFPSFTEPLNFDLNYSFPAASTSKPKRPKKILPKTPKNKVEELRNELFLDKVIELEIPEVVKARNRRKRKTL